MRSASYDSAAAVPLVLDFQRRSNIAQQRVISASWRSTLGASSLGHQGLFNTWARACAAARRRA
jgi:hypothetical protein